jgi:hypothetical protein
MRALRGSRLGVLLRCEPGLQGRRVGQRQRVAGRPEDALECVALGGDGVFGEPRRVAALVGLQEESAESIVEFLATTTLAPASGYGVASTPSPTPWAMIAASNGVTRAAWTAWA